MITGEPHWDKPGGELRPDLYLGSDFYLSHLGDTKTACHQIAPDPILGVTELCFPRVFWLIWFQKGSSRLTMTIVLDTGSKRSLEPVPFFVGGGTSIMYSQLEFDWDRLMKHSYVLDLLLIRLSLREREEAATD